MMRHVEMRLEVRLTGRLLIAVEGLNAFYQEDLDRYIRGEDVPLEQVQKVWRDSTGIFVGPVIRTTYQQFLSEVRSVNRGLPDRMKLRVIAADPPLDWAKVQSTADFRAILSKRVVFGVDVIEREALQKGQKALLVFAGSWFTRNMQHRTANGLVPWTETIGAGLDRDYQGHIGRSPCRSLGMVFQEPRLLPWRTVNDNVRLVAPRADEATLAALFDVLELASHRSHYPGELSLGLARRVALARAFAVDPDLLILDEPFVSMDQALAAKLRDELAMLVGRNPVTTLLVTHDVEEAAQLADRLFLLSPRPARILAELSIREPRAARTPEVIDAIKAEVARRIGAAGQPPASQSSGRN